MIQSITNELHFLEIPSNINRREQSNHVETPGILSQSIFTLAEMNTV